MRALLVVVLGVVLIGFCASANAQRSRAVLLDCACYDIVRIGSGGHQHSVLKNSGQNLYDLSRDRRHIAYGGRAGGLYISRLDGTHARLVDRRASHWAVISPDGRRVAYSVDGCALCIASIDGTHRRRFRVFRSRGPVAWSPDSRRLAFVVSGPNRRVDSGTLETATLGASRGRRLVAGRNFFGGTMRGVKMAWSRREGRLAYLAGASTRIHVLRLSDRRQLAVFDGRAPSWAPDGKHLAFTQGFRVAVVSLAPRKRYTLDPYSVDPYGFGVAWNAAGTWITYARYSRQDRYELAKATFRGGHRRVIATESDGVEIGPAWWWHASILYTRFVEQANSAALRGESGEAAANGN